MSPTADFDKFEMVLYKTQLQMATPGDIFFFRYKQELNLREIILVSTPHSPTGKFKSSSGNSLICCFELSNNNLKSVFRYFFKNSINSSYHSGLRLFFGENSFKTFDMKKSAREEKLI